MNSLYYSGIKLLTGNSHRDLAESVAKILRINLLDADVKKFSDGEISVNVNESVRGSDVFIFQSTSSPVNDNLMELLIMIDAMKRASAGRINAVIPYYGYARQDRKTKARDPISAKLVANLVTAAGADRVISMDLHCAQIQGFFDIPVDHLVGMTMFRDHYIKKFKDMSNVVVSPDLGSTTRARQLADSIHSTVAIVDKKRDKPNESKVMNLIGDVKGKIAIMIDDMIDTGGSIVNAAEAVMEAGAKEVHVCCTHGVFSGQALEKIDSSCIKEMIVLDTIAPKCEGKIGKIKYLTVAYEFAEAISRIHDGRPMSDMFDEPNVRYQ